jgi:hypothetical protein
MGRSPHHLRPLLVSTLLPPTTPVLARSPRSSVAPHSVLIALKPLLRMMCGRSLGFLLPQEACAICGLRQRKRSRNVSENKGVENVIVMPSMNWSGGELDWTARKNPHLGPGIRFVNPTPPGATKSGQAGCRIAAAATKNEVRRNLECRAKSTICHDFGRTPVGTAVERPSDGLRGPLRGFEERFRRFTASSSRGKGFRWQRGEVTK